MLSFRALLSFLIILKFFGIFLEIQLVWLIRIQIFNLLLHEQVALSLIHLIELKIILSNFSPRSFIVESRTRHFPNALGGTSAPDARVNGWIDHHRLTRSFIHIVLCLLADVNITAI